MFNEDGYCEAGTIRNSHREEDEEQVPRLTTFKFLEDRPDLMNRKVSLLPLPGILDAEVDVAALHVSGLRANEILGLYVEDLEVDGNLIWIRRGAWNGKIQTVKTPESETSLPMTPIVKQMLQAHLMGHTHQLLFPNKLGRPYNRGRVVKKIFHPILDKLRIPRKGCRVGFHAFRHTLASMLLQTTGVKVAQRQLRHSETAFTVEVYGPVLGDDHTDAMDNLESVLLGPSGS